MCYAKSEDEYTKHYEHFMNAAPLHVQKYFQKYQNSQENACARFSFLTKLQAWAWTTSSIISKL